MHDCMIHEVLQSGTISTFCNGGHWSVIGLFQSKRLERILVIGNEPGTHGGDANAFNFSMAFNRRSHMSCGETRRDSCGDGCFAVIHVALFCPERMPIILVQHTPPIEVEAENIRW